MKHGRSKNPRGGIFFSQKLLLILLSSSSLSSSSSSLSSWLLWYGSRPLGVDTTLGSVVCVVLGSQLQAWLVTILSVPGPRAQLQPGCAPHVLRGERQDTAVALWGRSLAQALGELLSGGRETCHSAMLAACPCQQHYIRFEKIEGKAIAKYIVPVTVIEMTLGLARLQSSCYGAPPVLQLMLLLL